MKQNLSTRGQGRAGSGLAKVMTMLAIMLFAATGAWAQEPATTYSVKMKDGTKDAKNWSIASGEKSAKGDAADGLTGLNEGDAVTLQYNGRLKVKGVKATSDAAPAAPTGNIVDLSTLTADYEAKDGDVLTGVTTSYKVTIAAGATVTLDGASISGSSYCIKCAGDATIILKDGSTNTLTSTGDALLPALSIGDANTTLTIQGSTGVLNVESGDYCAGIGGGYSNTNSTCGNIRIEGGVITVQGGYGGAGIGTDVGEATCGDIIITGGTITANGGGRAAGIGGGTSDYGNTVCGNITIANTVTKVTATKGNYAHHSIGKGDSGSCTIGTVTIGGTIYWDGSDYQNGGDTYLATSPLIYDPAAPATVLSGALVDGATIKVNFKWRMENSGDYVQGVYNAASGTFTTSRGGYDWNDDERAVYKVEKSGNNIIIGASFNNFSDSEAMVWTFNTTNDTYTTTNGTTVNAHPDWYGLISVTLNGTDITSQLTAQ